MSLMKLKIFMEDLKMRQTQSASKKDNRKSILVIGLLLLLVAVIGFGGYTMSKYVTKKSVKDNKAQVAKWGFTIETQNVDKLFSDKYKAGGTVASTGDALIVKADTVGTNLVAPGTKGSMSFTIGGKAEVKAKVTFEITAGSSDISLTYEKDNVAAQDPYAPVKWTLKKGNAAVEGCSGVSLTTILNKLDSYDETVEAGEELANAGTYTIEWEWVFDNTANADSDNLDTLLGMIANNAATTKYVTEAGTYTKVNASTNISFGFVITVEQVKA